MFFYKGESPTYFSKLKPTHDLPGWWAEWVIDAPLPSGPGAQVQAVRAGVGQSQVSVSVREQTREWDMGSITESYYTPVITCDITWPMWQMSEVATCLMCWDKAGNGEHVARVNGITTNRLSGSVISHKIMAIKLWVFKVFIPSMSGEEISTSLSCKSIYLVSVVLRLSLGPMLQWIECLDNDIMCTLLVCTW